MAYRRTPLALGETYHCYSRGIDRRITFQDEADYERFLQALYICNDVASFSQKHLSEIDYRTVLNLDRGKPLVSIIAYCLMPNHYHLVLREVTEGGITRFMHKVGTMYTMYFNAKNERIGGLFVKPFRSKHIDDDSYLQRLVPYVHLNPAELFEPGWKDGRVVDRPGLSTKLKNYRYSSLPEYDGSQRLESRILDGPVIGNHCIPGDCCIDNFLVLCLVLAGQLLCHPSILARKAPPDSDVRRERVAEGNCHRQCA